MPDPSFRVASRLLDDKSSSGDSFSVTVCANDSGAKWLRIERTSPNGNHAAINLPTSIAGKLAIALLKLAGRRVREKHEAAK